MDNPIIIKGKKRVFTEAVQEVCDSQNLPPPEINFDGCPLEGIKGPELAHSHPEQYKICISERQLKLQNSAGLRETAYHEMTHLMGLIQHGHQFENKKNELISKGWRPPKGVVFISGKTLYEANKRIREDPERLKWVNEDSDLVKALEGRTGHHGEYDSAIPKEIPRISIEERKQRAKQEKKIETKRYKSRATNKRPAANLNANQYRPMTDEEKKKSREKLGMAEERPHIEIPRKKKGLFDKLKEVLGKIERKLNWNKYECAWCHKPFGENLPSHKCPHCRKNFCENCIRVPNHSLKNKPSGGGLREVHHANGKMDASS
jgi:hypothetical protein